MKLTGSESESRTSRKIEHGTLGVTRTRAKLGRNDLCWCHSGQKYKHCHLDRDRQPVKQPWEIASDIREQFRASKYCTHACAGQATCQGQIVRSHSLPRTAGLAAIAEKGHVYGPQFDFMALVKNNGAPAHKLIGINEASTFTGFCGFHDHGTFEPLENQALTGSTEQCFLMGYRAVCRELFLKRLHLESIKTLREIDRGRSVDHQDLIQWIADLTQVGTMLGCAEISHHKDLYDSVLTRATWSEYHGLVVDFGVTPEVLYTVGFFPQFDFTGCRLQTLVDEPPLSLITVTILPSHNRGGLAVLGWENHSDTLCRQFADSFRALPLGSLGDALVRLGFEHVENIFTRPSWWESLRSTTRTALMDRVLKGADPEVPRSRECLKDDGLHYVNWPVLNIRTF